MKKEYINLTEASNLIDAGDENMFVTDTIALVKLPDAPLMLFVSDFKNMSPEEIEAELLQIMKDHYKE